MTADEQKSIQQMALRIHGIFNQQWMLVEECGELLNAIAKLRRDRVGKMDVITELADVSIIVEQMAFFYGEEEFNQERERKLLRLKDRLEKHMDTGQKPISDETREEMINRYRAMMKANEGKSFEERRDAINRFRSGR